MNRSIILSTAALAAMAPAVLAQTPLWSLNGSLPNSAQGLRVSVIGDFNGNGTDDVLVGEPGDLGALFTPGGGSAMVVDGLGGCITIFYGATDRGMGGGTARLPDIDGDGIDEILIGSPSHGAGVGATLFNGRVEMFLGGNMGAAGCTGAAASMPDLLIDDGTQAPAIQSYGAQFGRSIAAVGDVDGDNTVDFAVGAPLGNPTQTVGGESGFVRIYSGAAAATGTVAQIGVDIAGPTLNSLFGDAIVGIGDVDGDGNADYAIGAPNEGVGLASQNGVVRFYSGATATPFLTVTGAASERLGTALANLGDLDGDGFDEIALGAPGTIEPSVGTRVGSVTIVTSGSLQADITSGPITRTLALQPALYTLQGDDLYRSPAIPLAPDADDNFGAAISDVGDIDGDGTNDFIVGAPGSTQWDPDSGIAGNWPDYLVGPMNVGSARLISGASGIALRQVWATAPATGDSFGSAVAGGGDFDGDGTPDFIVGAREQSIVNPGDGGVYAYSGVVTFGTVYGLGLPNSTGTNGTLTLTGSQSLAENNLLAVVDDVPVGVFGILVMSPVQRIPPGSVGMGLQWLGNPLFRLISATTIPSGVPGVGTATIPVDVNLPNAIGNLVPDIRLNFTFYHRDIDPFGVPTVNFSDAVTAGFY